MEDPFGEVEVRDTDAIQGKVDDVIYNLWGGEGAQLFDEDDIYWWLNFCV